MSVFVEIYVTECNRKFGNKGFTLIEVLVIAGLAGFLALGSMSVVTSMMNIYKRMQAYQSLEITHLDIMTLLVNRGACTGTLGGIGSLASDPVITQIVDAAGTPRYQTGQVYDREFRIMRMQVQGFTPPATYPGAGSFNLLINYGFVSDAVKPSEVTRRITMVGNFSSPSVMINCWSDKAGDYDDLYINTSGPPETKNGNLTILGALDVRKNGAIGGNIITEEYFQTSDRRFKSDIKTIEDALQTLEKFRGVEFNWKDRNKKDWGFIAQEVEKVAPFLVNTDESTGYKSVNYSAIIALSVEAIKELDQKNHKIEKDFGKLKLETKKMIEEVCRDNSSYSFCRDFGG